jgi:hypothetical protein
MAGLADGGFPQVGGGFSQADRGFSQVDGGFSQADGGFSQADGGFSQADRSFSQAVLAKGGGRRKRAESASARAEIGRGRSFQRHHYYVFIPKGENPPRLLRAVHVVDGDINQPGFRRPSWIWETIRRKADVQLF